jgi:hypothetical protein
MTQFTIEHDTDLPDRVFVTVGNRFLAALIRTEDGLGINVYPITGGEVWDDPCDRFEVDEDEIRALERELVND